MAPEMPREQEQSIKARKRELFEAQAPTVGPLRRFSYYLGATPSSPLSTPQKAVLWAVGIVVLLLFLAAMLTIPSPRGRPQRPAGGGVSSQK